MCVYVCLCMYIHTFQNICVQGYGIFFLFHQITHRDKMEGTCQSSKIIRVIYKKEKVQRVLYYSNNVH